MNTNNVIIDLVDGFIACPDFDARWGTAQRALRDIGGRDINIGFFDTRQEQQKWILSTMCPTWRDRYRKRAYFKGDAILKHGKSSFDVITESIGLKTTGSCSSDTELRIDRDLADMGYRGSMAQTFLAPNARDRITTTLVADYPIEELGGPEFVRQFKRLTSVVAAFIDTPPRAAPEAYFNGPEPLTQKERDTLAYLAAGLMNDQIASRLNITEVAVRKRLNSARTKLGAATREQAVAIAVRDRLIDI
jgi:DNA-binding CsgD family transcriptional regulator